MVVHAALIYYNLLLFFFLNNKKVASRHDHDALHAKADNKMQTRATEFPRGNLLPEQVMKLGNACVGLRQPSRNPPPRPPPTPPLPPTHPPTNSWHNTTCRAEAHTFQNIYKQIVEHPPQLLAIHDVDEHSVVLLSFQRKPMGTMRYRLLEMTSSGSSTLTEQLGRRRRSKGASLIWCA